jgi:CrcB protein
MDRILWVCAGSALGGGARYAVALGLADTRFPLATLVVNLLGSFVMGALMFVGGQAALLPSTALLALTTGVMGGFTTYSAFSYETLRSLQAGAIGAALLNVAVTVLGGLAACAAGWTLARVAVA